MLCGQCFVVCPQNAKEIRNDVPAVQALLNSGSRVVVSLAPSFVANYPGATIDTMKAALKKLGFDEVEETAIGASIVKTEYEKIIAERRQKVIISTCCHSVNTMIQKYYPEAHALPRTGALADAGALQAHQEQDPEAKTVFIGPCISKKAECDESPYVDCVLTFEELTACCRAKIFRWKPETTTTKRAARVCSRRPGGILRSMACDDPEYTYMAIDGLENCIAAIHDIVSGNMGNCFIEMSACVGSCINGPAMDHDKRLPIQDFIAVNKYAGKRDFNVEQPASEAIHHNFEFVGLHRQMPGTAEIEAILRKMGKTRPEHELNCGACGYNSCREKALRSIRARPKSRCACRTCSARRNPSRYDHQQLGKRHLRPQRSAGGARQINASARKLMNIQNASDIIGEPVIRILDPRPFLDVMQTGRAPPRRARLPRRVQPLCGSDDPVRSELSYSDLHDARRDR